MSLPRSRAALAATALGSVVALLCVVFVARRLGDQWDAADDALGSASWVWLLGAVLTAVVGMTTMAAGWQRILLALGTAPRRAEVARWFFLGEITKYVPGSVWPILGRGELARRGGVPRPVAYQSVALSLVLLYGAAAAVGGVFVVRHLRDHLGGELAAAAIYVLALAAAVATLHPAVLRGFLRLARRATGRELDVPTLPGRRAAALAAGYVPTWLLVGLATWAVARSLDPGAPLLTVALATPAAWFVGFAALPVPGGVGVREATFVALTASSLAPGVAELTATAARLVFIVVDAGGAVLATRLGRRRRRAAMSEQNPRGASNP